MLRQPFHNTFNFCCILGVAFFLPLSLWLTSAISIAIVINRIIEGDFHETFILLKRKKEVLFIPALFLLYLFWLFNTSDFHTALNELKLKLPLLIFPLFAVSDDLLRNNRLRVILIAFIAGCTVAVAIGFSALSGIINIPLTDSRELALFVPSIRLSILINLAIFISLYLGLKKETGTIIFRSALIIDSVALSVFLFRLLSVTGLLIFIILISGTAVYFLFKKRTRLFGSLLIMTAIASAAVVITGLSSAWKKLHTPLNPEINIPVSATTSGNDYYSNEKETLIENGYLVWNNVCEKELRDGWNRRSKIPYDSYDLKGNELKVTLIRYITCLGMRKDSSAIASLSRKDIENIEKGFANPLYAKVGSPGSKWYELAWQADRYFKGANPSGQSVTQRLEFYRAAFAIIRRNALTGVGTGDVREAFDNEYRNNNTPLTEKYRLMAHNQYLTFAITFGIPGAVLALIIMIIPALKAGKRFKYIQIVFLSIIFVSMFNDDTFESATGATFFSYFYTLFLLNENDS